jgi:outer membrane scaffolding protein for murein synthesis (MipA/OmpV family)
MGFIVPVVVQCAHASSPVTEIHGVGLPAGSIGLGVGFRFGNTPYRGVDNTGSIYSDAPYDTMPYYYYEGQHLFSHGSTLGAHLLRGNGFSLDAILSYRFDRLEPGQDEFFRTVEAREQTLDGGLRATIDGDWGAVSLSWVTDTLDRHNGVEVDLSYRLRWREGRWTVSPFASYIYQDTDLGNYYYGVTDAESRDDLPGYRAGSSYFPRIGVNTSYRWSRRMQLFANLALEKPGDAALDSPLVDEDVIASALVGLLYNFGSITDGENATRRDPRRAGEWSWRVNYGYTADETFHKIHRGAFAKNKDVDTQLVGVTLGKLLLDGPRSDFWGKVSLNRRLENGLQDDFFELNAYAMIMGTGYSPWSSRELFRYGFGYGLSYADSIPIVEQIKQEDRGENTSHFLNYLEAQLDFPLRNLFGSQSWWRDCYAGLTIVHRSGAFGRIDLLGNVAGGSDVLSGHLECKR